VRPAPLAAAALVAALAASRPAAAGDDLPRGMIGLVGGVRQGTGAVAPAFGLGMLFGVEAGWQPMSTTQHVGWTARWRVLFSGYLSGQPTNLASSLRVLEMDAGGGIRIAPRPLALRYLFLGGGISMLRSNVPLPPDNHRSYVGGYGAVGLEQWVGTKLLLTFEVRVGQIGGPNTLTAMAGVKFGV